MRRSLKQRLEEDVYHGLDGCWYWLGPLNTNGYGRIAVPGDDNMWLSSIKAHRASYETFKGPIPNGMVICHRCDHPSCVNPDHLFIGTTKDNSDDMVAKGRSKYGDRHPFSKISNTEAQIIRHRASMGVSHTLLGKVFGLTRSTVSKIVRKDTYARI